jgi:hypothetical protein
MYDWLLKNWRLSRLTSHEPKCLLLNQYENPYLIGIYIDLVEFYKKDLFGPDYGFSVCKGVFEYDVYIYFRSLYNIY